MKPPAAIAFDFDHTLGTDDKLERRALERLAAECAGAAPPADVIDGWLAEFRSGECTLEFVVQRVVPATGDAGPATARFREIALAFVPSLVKPLPGAISVLRELAECGCATAILSNGWSPLQQAKAAQIEFAGPVLVSDAIGARKPQAAAFRTLLERLGMRAAEVWYVGDDPVADIAGALAAGLTAVWLAPPEAQYPPDLPPPSRTIAELRELGALLPGPPRRL